MNTSAKTITVNGNDNIGTLFFNIGNNIAIIRKSLKLKQTDMVAKLQVMGIDISIYSYNRIEKGTQNPTVSFLCACCAILNCDMNRLFDFN